MVNFLNTSAKQNKIAVAVLSTANLLLLGTAYLTGAINVSMLPDTKQVLEDFGVSQESIARMTSDVKYETRFIDKDNIVTKWLAYDRGIDGFRDGFNVVLDGEPASALPVSPASKFCRVTYSNDGVANLLDRHFPDHVSDLSNADFDRMKSLYVIFHEMQHCKDSFLGNHRFEEARSDYNAIIELEEIFGYNDGYIRNFVMAFRGGEVHEKGKDHDMSLYLDAFLNGDEYPAIDSLEQASEILVKLNNKIEEKYKIDNPEYGLDEYKIDILNDRNAVKEMIAEIGQDYHIYANNMALIEKRIGIYKDALSFKESRKLSGNEVVIEQWMGNKPKSPSS